MHFTINISSQTPRSNWVAHDIYTHILSVRLSFIAKLGLLDSTPQPQYGPPPPGYMQPPPPQAAGVPAGGNAKLLEDTVSLLNTNSKF